MSYILSNQYVRIEPRAASIGPRLIAFVLDSIFLFVFNIAMSFLVMGIIAEYVEDYVLVIWVFGSIFITLFYFPLMEIFFNGRSIGKMLMGLRVVKRDGSIPGISAYMLRWLLLFADAGITMVGIVCVLLSPLSQRLGDMAAGTMVISERELQCNRVNLMEYSFLTSNYRPVFAGARKLSDGQVEAVRLVLRQAPNDGGRRLLEMCLRVEEVVGPVPAGWTAYSYLTTVWKDAQYYRA